MCEMNPSPEKRGNYHLQTCQFLFSFEGVKNNDFIIKFYYNTLFSNKKLSKKEQIDLFMQSHLCDCHTLIGESSNKCKLFACSFMWKKPLPTLIIHIPYKGFKQLCHDEKLHEWVRKECCFCLNDIFSTDEIDSIVRIIPCNHLLHFKCLMDSYQRSNGLTKCPICRAIINNVCVTSEGLQITRNGELQVNHLEHINASGRRWSF